jgi:hypothetical protein
MAGWDGPEGLWVNEHGGTDVVRLDPETGDELARTEIGGRPGVTLGLGGVWARSDDEKRLARIDSSRPTAPEAAWGDRRRERSG